MKIEIRSSELLILIGASVMSFIANLPDSYLNNLVDRRMLLSALTALVVVAMFRYLQVVLLLTISVLAIGANLPAELATALGISQFALIVSLAALIGITLLNRKFKLLPTDRGNPAILAADARREMMAAISKGDQVTIHRLLAMNVNVNFILNGMTPLHLAAEKGYPEIVRLLIDHGADYRKTNEQGQTPLEIAQGKKKFVRTQAILRNVSETGIAADVWDEPRRGDADVWANAA